MPQLSVNIDHVATLRQARYRGGQEYGEPDVLRALHEVELGGADGVTLHLREDRRHVIDRDVETLRAAARVKFNLEMAATDEMVAIARRIRPHSAMLVPEGRDEVTTEGGLDVSGQLPRLRTVVHALRDAGCQVSAFIDAQPHQVQACADAGFDVCEVHTGPYAHAFLHHGGDFRAPGLREHLERIAQAGQRILALGMRFNAGHALGYANVGPIARLAFGAQGAVSELHIGHAIVSRAVFVGIREATRQMKDAMGAGG